MSTFSIPPKSGLLARVQPLRSSRADGKPYERSATVQTEIGRILCLPQSDWIAEAEDLQNETLVFLIRQTRRADPQLYDRLFQELSKRITRLARRSVRGFDRTTAQEIVLKVEIDILELVLAEEPSRKTDFLEIAFAQAIERRTLNAVRNHNNSPMGRRGEILADATNEDGDEIERPIELAADDRPGPEAVLLQLQDEARRPELLQKAYDAVEDPRHLEAVILHYSHGWPITCKDPGKKDLARHFNATPRQIKYWIATALKAMREALEIGE